MHHILLSPMTWALLWGVAMWWLWRRGGAVLRGILVVSGLAILLLCTPLGANALVRLVESRASPAQRCDARWNGTPIVVLAGGLAHQPRALDDYIALTPSSWRRLRGGVELWRSDPGAMLVIAGGGPYSVKESVVMANLARDWGVPAALLREEAESLNTWQSAMQLRGTLPGRVRVVSSATHLPRTLTAFRAAGFTACGWASDSAYVPFDTWGYFVPQLSAMQKTQLSMYELAGMASYGWRAHRN
jgi:uncharacterized SAM-binding protein YcdF (DUF218 family)